MNRSYTALAVAALLAACSTADEGSSRAGTVRVARGPMRITQTESGTIQAREETRVMNRMNGETTVVWMIEEGTRVEEGEVVVRLDASEQEDEAATYEIEFEKATADLIRAQEDLEILKKQCESNLEAATNAVIFAEMDLNKFFGGLIADEEKMGEREQAIKEEEANIKLADANVKLAFEKWDWSKKLQAEDFITATELERDRLDYESKAKNLEIARSALAILKQYTHEKTSLELTQKLTDAELEKERTISKNAAQLSQAEADLKRGERELALGKERFENFKAQISNSVVKAPHAGIVVYGKEGGRGRQRFVEAGAEVRQGQKLISLPNITKMRAELTIPEVMIEKIFTGQEAWVTVDTIDGPIPGVVSNRAPLPDSGSVFTNPDLKVYKTWVDILGANEDNKLLPNMSATVEIVIAELDDVLFIPIKALQTQGSVNYVWIWTPEGPLAKRIETGDHNTTHIIVLAGLAEGQEVYLIQPQDAVTPVFDQTGGIQKSDTEPDPEIIKNAAPSMNQSPTKRK